MRIEKVNEKQNQNSPYPDDSDSFVMIEGNKPIAYLSFNMKSEKVMWLDLIQVLDKRKGWGTKIVHFLFQHFDLERIEGFSFCEEEAYRFWTTLGAKFYYVEEEGYNIDELLDAGLESPFTLVVE